MTSKMELLECPMCDFTVLQKDDYILQLHFEQVHTENSPFVIEDDPEPLPPSLPLRPSSLRHDTEDTPSSDDSEEEESTTVCPDPNCGEVVPLSDFNDHLEYHNAETLSFDETTGKYHSHHSSATMQGSTSSRRSHASQARTTTSERSFSTDLSDALKRTDAHGRKSKKHPHRHRRDTDESEKSTIGRSILGFNPFAKPDKSVKPPIKSARLGKSELGPYAWENRMPRWLHDQLDAGPKITAVNRIGRDGRLIKHDQVQNETPGIIPILAQLSALDRTVKEAYYCHPSTLHVGKTPSEGGFCGYRNIQMLLSYIQGAKAQGYEEFPGRLPTILKMQDHIEDAWDKGINSIGRVQTGGIRDTRKYIGTPEAQAFFLNSEINCAVEQFSDNKDRAIAAHELLLAAMERYFARAAASDGSNVSKTLLPPIYLQQPGHSISIVGFERRFDGSCNLVVFDPMYLTSPAMHKLLGRKSIRTARPEVLYAYRRGAGKLKKYAAYEILMLTASPPLFPAWDMGLIDNVLLGPQQMRNGCRTPSASSQVITGLASPPASPSRCVSPRTTMLKKFAGKQGYQDLSPKSMQDLRLELEVHPSARNHNAYPASPPSSIRSFSSASHRQPASPSFAIANGVESEATSPIDPSGTMLFYTSNRSVDSGLLGVCPLSEPQVAEYRFWRPCGRRICGFGCGGANIGEAAAAKRLFRQAEEVIPEMEDEVGNDDAGMTQSEEHEYGLDGQADNSTSDAGHANGDGKFSTSTWAGRRLVMDWNQFLSGCERDGIAQF
ncbi:hypothetical protein J4E81_004402 [Alternaria sp. BMP 2799]|nr:hypothetical protein J4E81_004402 [Alternaria sp. BMP 2799]